ncbi:MAG: acyl--CoA ligase [Acetobacteraceae bacterium]|nr:acyl--CoA ligase [Acetobacteraceae bacterium]
MPPASRRVLRDLVAGPTASRDRFIADEIARLPLPLPEPWTREAAARLAGSSVVVACDRQLAFARALVALDGLARRIVLCPPDLAGDALPGVLDLAEADAIVSDRGWPDPHGRDVVRVEPAPATDATAPPDPSVSDPSSPDASLSDASSPDASLSDASSSDRPSLPSEWALFTSGTTGGPKMVVHTLESLSGHLRGSAAPAEPPVWCTFYDVRRYGGLQILLRALLGGGSLVLSAPGEAAGQLLARAAALGASHFLGTPTHWRNAMMAPEAAGISPRYVRLSGEVADQAILDRLAARYPDAALVHAFASTEAGVAFEVTDRRAGVPAALIDGGGSGEVRLRVRDGALQVRSPRVAARRLNGASADLTDADGFIDTGDLLERRGDRFHFVGRREGIINVGGNKVHPEEIETVINRHPRVRISLVRARTSPITGAVVTAEVVADAAPDGANQAALASDVIALCRRELAAYKVPASVRVVPSLAVAASGKLARPRA